MVVSIIVLFGGHVERLKLQLEVWTLHSPLCVQYLIAFELTLAVSSWLKLVLDISWAWVALSVIRDIYHPSGSYWTIVNRVMQVIYTVTLSLAKFTLNLTQGPLLFESHHSSRKAFSTICCHKFSSKSTRRTIGRKSAWPQSPRSALECSNFPEQTVPVRKKRTQKYDYDRVYGLCRTVPARSWIRREQCRYIPYARKERR